MSLTPFELALNDPTIVIVPWYDDVVDPIGYDPRSFYVETFWLNVLGPTATWLMRRMVTGLDEYPGGYELDLDQTASALGLTFTPGASNPFARSLNRCVLFGAAQPVAGGLAVRRRLPPVANRHLQRMPPYLRTAHEAWSRRSTTSSDELARARGLAQAMVQVGDPMDAVERQLLGLGVPPHAAVEVAAALEHAALQHDFAPDAA
jgi:hypothetical protein